MYDKIMADEFTRFIEKAKSSSLLARVVLTFALWFDYDYVYDKWVYTKIRRITKCYAFDKGLD